MSDKKIVYPTAVTSVRWNGGAVRLRPEQAWPADDPFVRAKPEFFSDTPVTPARSLYEPPVERATARPGEVREMPRRGRPPRRMGGAA